MPAVWGKLVQGRTMAVSLFFGRMSFVLVWYDKDGTRRDSNEKE